MIKGIEKRHLFWVGFALIVGVIAFFILAHQKKEAPPVEQKDDKPWAVTYQIVHGDPTPLELVLTGETSSYQSVAIKSKMDGTIQKILVKQGESVKAGAPLVKLAPEAYISNLDAAKADLLYKQRSYENTQRLVEKGAMAPIREKKALSDLKAAEKDVADAEERVNELTIVAPFNGVVGVQLLDRGSYVRDGDVVFKTLSQLNPLIATVYISEFDIQKVRLGQKAFLTFPDNQEIEGYITFIDAAADPATRAFHTEITFENKDHKILDGMSCTVKINYGQSPLVMLPPHLLTLADDGEVGVKILDPDDMVEFIPVEVIKTTSKALYVKGIPEGARLITSGQEYVKAGSKVKAVLETTLDKKV